MFIIVVVKGHKVIGHHQHLSNRPFPGDIIYQSIHKVQTPLTDYSVRDNEVLIW